MTNFKKNASLRPYWKGKFAIPLKHMAYNWSFFFSNRCLVVNKSLAHGKSVVKRVYQRSPREFIAFPSGRRVGLEMNQSQRAIAISRKLSNLSQSFSLTKIIESRQNNVKQIPGDKVWVRKMTNILRLSSCLTCWRFPTVTVQQQSTLFRDYPKLCFAGGHLLKKTGQWKNIV